ncbi:MAG: tetratricopeptide repeat protein, partial [Actinomycetota bacterium]
MRIAVVAALATLAVTPAVAKPKQVPPTKPAADHAADSHHGTLSAAAHRGDAEAQYQLGVALRDGHGVKRDPRQAVEWFALAATNGIAPAAVEVAKAFEQGTGVKADKETAARWWYRAGELGDQAAQKRFVEMYMAGQSHSLGGPAGARWLEEVADGGSLEAALSLGEAYEEGLGVAPDLLKAERWYRLGATLYADPEARYRLGRMLLAERGFVEYDENRVVKEVSRPGMVEGERWLLAAARQGHARAQFELGRAYVGGVELPPDLPLGLGWLQAAGVQGDTDALILMADLAVKGQGYFAKDPVRAFVYYDLASGMGAKPADDARDRIAKTLNQKQLARGRQ